MRSLKNPSTEASLTRKAANSSEPLIYQLVYASSALYPWEAGERDVLLLEGRRRNAAVGITGVLIAYEGRFLQVLEGPQSEVKALFARIRSDTRHFTVTLLWEGFVAARDFPDSPMAFQEGGEADADFLVALRAFSEKKLPARPDPNSPVYPFTDLLLKKTG